MEFNELKSTWNTVKTPEISSIEMRKMFSENRHPALKSIRKQLIIEIIGWCILLICYYTMFDGDKKPVWINILLVFSILLPVIHNLMGYRFAKYLVQGTNIQESLKNYLAKVKRYAAISIISKQLFLIGLLLFFTYGLTFNTSKYISLVIIGLIFTIQIVLTYRIWAKRLAGLEKSINLLS